MLGRNYLSANDMTYFHQMIIDDASEVISRPTIRLQENWIFKESLRTRLWRDGKFNVSVQIIVDSWPG